MSFSRKALLALTGIAALAMPLAVAGAASAATSTGCTVTPLKPVFDHLNSSGDKVIRYDTKVYLRRRAVHRDPGRAPRSGQLQP